MSDPARDAMNRGRQAKLELEQTDAAFAGLRGAALEAIVKCPPDETNKLNRLIAAVQTVDAVKDALERAVRDGTGAAAMDQHTRHLIEAGVISG